LPTRTRSSQIGRDIKALAKTPHPPFFYLSNLLFFTVAMAGIAQSAVQPPDPAVVWVDPNVVTLPSPGVGLTFTISIKIDNVTNMAAYEYMVWWERKYLNVTKAVDTAPPAWTSPSWLGPGIQWNYNATHGRYWKGCVNLPAIAVNGSFTVANITFTAVALGGPSPISVYIPGSQYPAKLSDPGGNAIECTGVDGEVEVIPEFPTGLIMPLLMITTLVAAVLGKKAWLRRRKSPFVAT